MGIGQPQQEGSKTLEQLQPFVEEEWTCYLMMKIEKLTDGYLQMWPFSHPCRPFLENARTNKFSSTLV